ncbi:MAG: hypothetical protein Athens041674_91 [Parcubacteria group bacterium Athens0416_74]|nr:MAG: hypothetical protein Athens041674_91 [Parcubacteria group bacterium Athens0416_74]
MPQSVALRLKVADVPAARRVFSYAHIVAARGGCERHMRCYAVSRFRKRAYCGGRRHSHKTFTFLELAPVLRNTPFPMEKTESDGSPCAFGTLNGCFRIWVCERQRMERVARVSAVKMRAVRSYHIFETTFKLRISPANSFVRIRSHNISSYIFSLLKIKKVIHII